MYLMLRKWQEIFANIPFVNKYELPRKVQDGGLIVFPEVGIQDIGRIVQNLKNITGSDGIIVK